MLILLCQMFHPNNFSINKGISEDVAVINYFSWEGLESSDGAPCVVITLGYNSFITLRYPLLIYCLANSLPRRNLLIFHNSFHIHVKTQNIIGTITLWISYCPKDWPNSRRHSKGSSVSKLRVLFRQWDALGNVTSVFQRDKDFENPVAVPLQDVRP